MPDAPHQIASTDDVELRVHELGGTGPPLLFAHATGLHAHVWGPVSRHVSSYRAIALDFRGHGDSSAPDDHDFDWMGFADDILAVVEALALDSVPAVGHSKGAAALLLAEERRPGTFSSLWCYEPVVFPGDRQAPLPENPLAAAARKRRQSFPSRSEALENFSSKPPFAGVATESLEAYVDGAFQVAEDGSLLLKCEPEHEARVYEMGAQHRAFDNLTDVQCPTVIARGRIEMGPAAFADAVADRLPNGRLATFEHLGHFGPLEAPAEIGGEIGAFLRLHAADVPPLSRGE